MREIAEALASWETSGVPFAIATVVQTWKSSPRQPGAAMAVSATGEVVGSVSGGCVEGAVYELAQQVIETKVPVLQTYGVSDDDAYAVGLTCGGIIDVFVQPVDPDHFRELPGVLDDIAQRRSVAVATVISTAPALRGELVVPADPAASVRGGLRDPSVQADVVGEARRMLARGETGVIRVPALDLPEEEVSVFVQSFEAPPLMLVFGAIDFAGAVARVGKFLGYHVVVCDARPVFATEKRFPEADEVVVMWPHKYLEQAMAEHRIDQRTVICVLTHDPKFDVPVLQVALTGPAAYVGAMGSRRTHEDRLARLREVGLTEEQLARLSSPIGLDLGAATPEETAVAIAAEFIMLSRGGSAGRLVDGQLAIHR
jgi:xanthine dehydrogenase accessory factor